MIGYLMLGTNDLDRAAGFYDALLAELGAKRAMSDPGRFIGWSNRTGPMLAITRPHDGNEATVGNGVMIALAAGSKEAVDKIHAAALSLGGTDEGAPGLRTGTFYGGYFRDLDGNKLVAFHM
ncbi:MAG: glyoxalase [Alphaproteobacteria bacterium HGW-Alphaproteobacteria-12]|nr:MAG: glyoxalase [Alphaproteobacteria bacterium HGW-Alphaproteobacteria-12]